MDTSFILSCESTIDLPYSYCEARGIPVLFYSYQVDGVSYEDDMGREKWPVWYLKNVSVYWMNREDFHRNTMKNRP